MTRLTFSLIAVVLVAFVGLGWAIDQWYNLRYAPDDDKTLVNYKMLGAELRDQLDRQHFTLAELKSWSSLSPIKAEIIAYDAFPVPANLAANFERGEPLLLDSSRQISLHYYLPFSRSVLSLNMPVQDSGNAQLHIKIVLTLIFYGGVIGLLMIWLWPLLRRLTLLKATAQAVGRGELTRRIPTSRISYIRSIEHEFNAMAARLENLIRDNKMLSRGLSHDLRTPLARLRFGLDVLSEDSVDAGQRAKLEHINRDLVDMELLVEILLEYSKLEEANIHLRLLPTDINQLMRELIHTSYSREVDLHVESIGPVIVLAHAEYMAMLLHNIIQNALRYGGGITRLHLCNSAEDVVITLEDNGPGIPDVERQQVLKPFYRLHQNTPIKGHGLGLALVERIAHWHQATLRLGRSARLGGLLIEIRLMLNGSY